MAQQALAQSQTDLVDDQLGFFRWGRIAGKILITSDTGDWSFVNEVEFQELLGGKITQTHSRFAELQQKGFLRDGLDLDALTAKLSRRNRHIGRGPHLHVVTVAQSQARGGSAFDGRMTTDIADRIIDLALATASQNISFEFQGHDIDALTNFEVLRHFVESTRARNRLATGKDITFKLFSSFTAMTEEIAEWLIANDVVVCTTLDGPADLHDWNRQWAGGCKHAEVVAWMEYLNRRYGELGRDPKLWHTHALVWTSRRVLERGREVVDEYVSRGVRTIFLRPLDRTRVGPDAWGKIGYAPVEYLKFYRDTLAYILELNRRGIDISEGTATIFLTKILTVEDPGVVDIQSPFGAGTGQIAYDARGSVFPCEEARVVATNGDPMFEIGSVGALAIPDIVHHPTVRAIALASLLDSQPMCADCWNKPYCGFSPVYNYASRGDLFGQRPHSLECKEHMFISATLFELLTDASETADVLKRWTTQKPRLAFDTRVTRVAP